MRSEVCELPVTSSLFDILLMIFEIDVGATIVYKTPL